MSPRTLAGLFFLIDVLLFGLIGWLLGQSGEEGATASDVLRENAIPVAILGVVVVGLLIGQIVIIIRVHSRELRESEDLAASAFEKQMMNEMSFRAPVASEPSPVTVAPANPAPEMSAAAPAPNPAPASPPPAAGGVDLTPLLTQLRLGGLDPVVEGKVQRGELEGSALLRLAGDEVGIALMRLPAKDDWGRLFPRYDRVFVPTADGHWFAAERIEGLVRRGGGDVC